MLKTPRDWYNRRPMMTFIMQSPFQFWFGAHHTGHLIPVPKELFTFFQCASFMCDVTGCHLVIPELNACLQVVACGLVFFFLFCTVYIQVNEEYIFFKFCTKANKCTINWQIITPLYIFRHYCFILREFVVSTLLS